jgi:hypothetical protein
MNTMPEPPFPPAALDAPFEVAPAPPPVLAVAAVPATELPPDGAGAAAPGPSKLLPRNFSATKKPFVVE